MARFRHVVRGGSYVRVIDPAWSDPLDGSYAAERGGRWNPPSSFPVVYLCAGLPVARANVLRRFAGLPYGPLDLLPGRRPALAAAEAPEGPVVDVISDRGCRAAGLPTGYPLDERGAPVPWTRCQPVGVTAWTQGERAIGCRSSALRPPERGEELAWFPDRAGPLRLVSVRSFDGWFG